MKHYIDDLFEAIIQQSDRSIAENNLQDAQNQGWFDRFPDRLLSAKKLILDRFGPPLNIIKNRKMITYKKVSELPPIEYIFQEWGIQKGTLNILCGTGESGKSAILQLLAICVASNDQNFLGKWEVSHGKVVHIDHEQSEALTDRRYARLAAGLDITYDLNIERIQLNQRLDDFPNDYKLLADRLAYELRDAKLCIIDSLKSSTASDESSSEIEKPLKLLREVAQTTGCAIIIIHHKGKGKDAKQSGRGSSAIFDAADTQMDVDRDEHGKYKLEQRKNRDGQHATIQFLTIHDEGDYCPNIKKEERLVLSLITSEYDEGEKKIPLRTRILDFLDTNPGANQKAIKNEMPESANNCQTAIDILVSEDNVKISEKRGAANAKLHYITEKGKSLLTSIKNEDVWK